MNGYCQFTGKHGISTRVLFAFFFLCPSGSKERSKENAFEGHEKILKNCTSFAASSKVARPVYHLSLFPI
jgi:hypothetical protein